MNKRKKRNELKWLTPYFGGAEGAFQENIHDIVLCLESVRSQAVIVGEGLDYHGTEPEEDIREMERQTDKLLSKTLDLRLRVAELSALLQITEEE